MPLKVASLREGGRDGRLVVVSRDLTRAVRVPDIALTLQAALDDWACTHPELAAIYRLLNEGGRSSIGGESVFAFDPAQAAAPLPRAYQWADGSAYLSHVERVRKMRGAGLPPDAAAEPLMYQGMSDGFLGPRDAIAAIDEAHCIDFEAEVAIVTDDVPMALKAEAASAHIKLLLLVNDVSLRALVPGELAKGFGFFQSKPASAASPVAVTPAELGSAWTGGRVTLPVLVDVNSQRFGVPDAGLDMTFEFPALIAHAARTRRLGAGTIIGGGTVSNQDPGHGFGCIVEKRAHEVVTFGKATTPFLHFGDRVRIEMLDAAGHSVFGAIDQQVIHYGS